MADRALENSVLIIPISNQLDLAIKICPQLHKLQRILPVGRIVFVADRCQDTSDELIRNAITGDPYFQLLPYRGEATGQAAALMRAISICNDYFIYAFCDFDHLLDAQELARFLSCFKTGSAALRGIRKSRRMSPFRLMTSAVANRVAAICLSSSIPDIGSPLLVTRREVIEKGLTIHQTHGPLFFPLLYPLITDRIEQEEVVFHEAAPSSYSASQLMGLAMLFIQTAMKLRGLRRLVNAGVQSESRS